MKRELATASLVVLAALAMPANAQIHAQASVWPTTGVHVGVELTLRYTKETTAVTDAAQAGSIQIEITGPVSFALEAQAYTLTPSPTGNATTLVWTWVPTVPGFYDLAFVDTVTLGEEHTLTLNVSVEELPNQVPANGVSYNEDGEAVQRNWGDFLLVPNGQDQASRTYLKLHNPATQAARFFALFHDTKFRATNGDSIPLAGNVAFQVGLGETPRSGLSTLEASPDGRFSMMVAPGETVWLGYVVLQLPATMSASLYLAPYTLGGQP